MTHTDMIACVRNSVLVTGLNKSGYTVDRVGTHSLRAGGAMALAFNGYDATTIKKMGR